jgi:hypothetical protein
LADIEPPSEIRRIESKRKRCKTAWKNDKLIGKNSVKIDLVKSLLHYFLMFKYIFTGKADAESGKY